MENKSTLEQKTGGTVGLNRKGREWDWTMWAIISCSCGSLNALRQKKLMIGFFKNMAVYLTMKAGLMEIAASVLIDEYAEDFYGFIVTRFYHWCKGDIRPKWLLNFHLKVLSAGLMGMPNICSFKHLFPPYSTICVSSCAAL